ncbi:hypothetical protein OESDEN_09316 [Oesophagostomum dentatum]|uniref:Uncharacterized protein n=1 Tax=Oesophagostomum dentatum TaxID=61180 RepID=A0A0B1T5Z6_OESDE|nr:hypothetical protein OESDEN_09316 [Oesophagostomum dentatum]
MVVKCLSSNSDFFNELLGVMHHDGWKEEKSICTVLEWTLNDFAVFVAEFWQHVGVINKSPAEYVDLSLEDALKIIGIDLRNIVPEEEYVNAWIKHFTPFILWNYDTSRKVRLFLNKK